jgi:hypothetical protein
MKSVDHSQQPPRVEAKDEDLAAVTRVFETVLVRHSHELKAKGIDARVESLPKKLQAIDPEQDGVVYSGTTGVTLVVSAAGHKQYEIASLNVTEPSTLTMVCWQRIHGRCFKAIESAYRPSDIASDPGLAEHGVHRAREAVVTG